MKLTAARLISLILRLFYKLRYDRRVVFGKRVIVNCHFQFRGPGKLIIGDDVNLWAHEEPNRFMTFDKNAVITLGDRCRVNGVTVQSKTSVTIGTDCLIGSAMLIDTDFHSIDPAHRNDAAFIKSAPITVGNHVWLAGQSALLKGVTIGDEAVAGFRAVVTHDVPPGAVVAGNPAVIVKEKVK